MIELLQRYFDDFTSEQQHQFSLLKGVYTEWNEKINVISRKDIDHFYEHHVLHSLAIAAIAEWKPGTKVIDIGTGGGFPGIPLAIFFPEVQFHLTDSIGKKLKVVDAVVEALQLKNVTTQHTRSEAIRDRKFDYAVSRAVAPLKELWSWGKPLIKKGQNGLLANGLICLKGGDLAQEIFESGVRPRMMPISELFKEPYFQEKYIVHVAKV